MSYRPPTEKTALQRPGWEVTSTARGQPVFPDCHRRGSAGGEGHARPRMCGHTRALECGKMHSQQSQLFFINLLIFYGRT